MNIQPYGLSRYRGQGKRIVVIVPYIYNLEKWARNKLKFDFGVRKRKWINNGLYTLSVE